MINITPERPFILGVDPGINGALAVYDVANKTIVEMIDTPNKINPRNNKTEIDLYPLAVWIDSFASKLAAAMIEDVSAAPGQGVVSMFNFGKVFGSVNGVLAAHYIPLLFCKAAVWKSLMGLSSNKNLSRELASKLFPSHISSFKRVKDDGRAESCLLAKFGADKFCVNKTDNERYLEEMYL